MFAMFNVTIEVFLFFTENKSHLGLSYCNFNNLDPDGVQPILANRTHNSLQFAWNTLQCEHIYGDFRCYRYKLVNAANGTVLVQKCLKDIDDNNVTFPKLTPCTGYGFHIRVQNKDKRVSSWAKLEADTEIVGEFIKNLIIFF